MCYMLDTPEEVITRHILPYLQLGDLLRLRRVCKFTNKLASDFIRLYVRTSKEITVGPKDGFYDGEDDEHKDSLRLKQISMSTLLGMQAHLPSACFRLRFPNTITVFEVTELGEDWKLEEFLERYGEQVTHLRVSYVRGPMWSAPQNAFYERLPNLRELVIDCLDLVTTLAMENKRSKSQNIYEFPTTFKSLRKVHVKNYRATASSAQAYMYFWKLFEHCHNAEDFGYPNYAGTHLNETESDTSDSDSSEAEVEKPTFNLWTYSYPYLMVMLKRGLSDGERAPALKTFDIGRISDDELYANSGAGSFIASCVEFKPFSVKMANVKADILRHWYMPPGPQREEIEDAIRNAVVSLHGLTGRWLEIGLPYLERLTLDSRSCSIQSEDTFFIQAWRLLETHSWPSLASLEVLVNSKKMADERKTEEVFEVLFGIQRSCLSELKLRFEEEEDEEPEDESDDEDILSLPVSSAKSITSSCSNLKRLSIRNWCGTNKALSVLWKGLLLLEEVCLDGCISMGNSAFVGSDVENLVFLGLRNLRKLSLLSLDKMPKVTDTVFELILRHMKLRVLFLSCSEEGTSLSSVTVKGIEALLSGEFARAIENFPFDCWSLADVSGSEFNKLRDRFISSL